MPKPESKKIIVRYPPSPTGLFHVGTARTCLYNYLFAKKNNGQIIFRLEDTDLERSTDEYAKNIAVGLKKLGIEADEGYDIGGDYGPYLQTERTEIYKKHLKKLLDSGQAYYCCCTKEELDKKRKIVEKEKRAYRYDGQCRKMSPEEKEEMAKKNKDTVIRLAVPEDVTGIEFEDVIRGKIKVEKAELDDFIIAKSLDEPLYNFAVVVDDHLMNITHVIRGEDHISNTPRQILVYQAFDWNLPEFAHLPLILNQDKSKLSKRKNKVSVDDYLDEGYLPGALINFLVLIGWTPGDDREIFTLDELVKEFSLERVHKAGAIFNLEKLDWLNNQHIKTLAPKDLIKRIKPYLEKAKYDYSKNGDEYLIKAVKTIQERLFKLTQAAVMLEFYFIEPRYEKDLLYNEKMKVDEELVAEIWPKIVKLINGIDEKRFSEEDLKKEFMDFIAGLGLKNGQVLWPIRVALTGEEKSPGVFEVMAVLGKEESLKRINNVVT